jgi:hypothetical protein
MGKPGRYEAQAIEPMILNIRDQKVILDADLARIYGVPTKRLNEQVRRNADRFPPDFAFVLTDQEVTNLKSQFATSSLSLNLPPLLLCTSHLPKLLPSQRFKKGVYYNRKNLRADHQVRVNPPLRNGWIGGLLV